mmetsp:Transcript_24559/g.54695  ORF Transcript_24559/g.54695 Transcript_24559/m.54695 type:complete len:392 (-) Transcript_24559:148-1323(-)
MLARCCNPSCFTVEGVCPATDATDVYQLVRNSCDGQVTLTDSSSAQVHQRPLLLASGRRWDLAPPVTSSLGEVSSGNSGYSSPSSSWTTASETERLGDVAGLGCMGEAEHRAWAEGLEAGNSPRSWHAAIRRQRARASHDRALVQAVSEWGPLVGRLVDLRTGQHRPVTYWLRMDARSLCIFDTHDTQVRVYPAARMENAMALEASQEVAARRFFLGLDLDAMRRGLLITMEHASHDPKVIQQGHFGTIKARLVLLVSSRQSRKDMLGALRALISCLPLRESTTGSVGAFRQAPDNAFKDKNSSNWRRRILMGSDPRPSDEDACASLSTEEDSEVEETASRVPEVEVPLRAHGPGALHPASVNLATTPRPTPRFLGSGARRTGGALGQPDG